MMEKDDVAGIEAKFLDRVSPEPNTGCWLWLGADNGDGYGQLWDQRRNWYAHRLAYQLYVGHIPDGMHLDHLCRVRCCVNPDHLEPVTPRENNFRGVGRTAQNAMKTHCLRGHPLDGDNLYVSPDGKRSCKECRREQLRASRQRRRQRKMEYQDVA